MVIADRRSDLDFMFLLIPCESLTWVGGHGESIDGEALGCVVVVHGDGSSTGQVRADRYGMYYAAAHTGDTPASLTHLRYVQLQCCMNACNPIWGAAACQEISTLIAPAVTMWLRRWMGWQSPTHSCLCCVPPTCHGSWIWCVVWLVFCFEGCLLYVHVLQPCADIKRCFMPSCSHALLCVPMRTGDAAAA